MPRSLFARLASRFDPERVELSRRRMLRASLAAGAGLVLGGAGRERSARGEERVIVIGAGSARGSGSIGGWRPRR